MRWSSTRRGSAPPNNGASPTPWSRSAGGANAPQGRQTGKANDGGCQHEHQRLPCPTTTADTADHSGLSQDSMEFIWWLYIEMRCGELCVLWCPQGCLAGNAEKR